MWRSNTPVHLPSTSMFKHAKSRWSDTKLKISNGDRVCSLLDCLERCRVQKLPSKITQEIQLEMLHVHVSPGSWDIFRCTSSISSIMYAARCSWENSATHDQGIVPFTTPFHKNTQLCLCICAFREVLVNSWPYCDLDIFSFHGWCRYHIDVSGHKAGGRILRSDVGRAYTFHAGGCLELCNWWGRVQLVKTENTWRQTARTRCKWYYQHVKL